MLRVPSFNNGSESQVSTALIADEPAEVVRKPLKVKAVWIPMDQWRWLRDTAAAERRTMQGLLAEILNQRAEVSASHQQSGEISTNVPTDLTENLASKLPTH